MFWFPNLFSKSNTQPVAAPAAPPRYRMIMETELYGTENVMETRDFEEAFSSLETWLIDEGFTAEVLPKSVGQPFLINNDSGPWAVITIVRIHQYEFDF